MNLDVSYSEDVDYITMMLHRGFRCLLKAIAWYSSTIVAGKEIAGLEIILYATCFLLYTMDESAARALMARMIICAMILFESQSPVIPISVASYFIFYSETFESFTESLLCKLATFRLISYVADASVYWYMYAIMGFIAIGYKDFPVRGVEDLVLLFAVAVPLVQSFMEAIANHTLLVVFISALFWGDRKLNRLVQEGYLVVM